MKKFILLLVINISFFLNAQTSLEHYEKALELIEVKASRTKIDNEIYQAIKKDSTNSKALFLIGKRLLEKRSNAIVIDYLKKAHNLDKSNLDYKWYLSEAIIKYNVKDLERTLEGVFEGVELLDEMISLGAKSVRIYKRKATVNKAIYKDYQYRYTIFKPKKSDGWQDEKLDYSEKERLKKISLSAYNALLSSCNEILKLEPENSFAKSELKALKKPFSKN